MPRPTLFNNPKFRVASKRLGIPEPHLLGYLEYLWASANECGNPDFTCSEGVEAAARWVGEDGKFAEILSRPGSNFLDVIDEGGFTIHDYWEHIPEYVPGRKRNEDNRKVVRVCEHCATEYRSSRANAKYCSASCRQLGYIERKPTDTNTVTPKLTATSRQIDGRLTGIDDRLTDVDGTPAPAPAHTPIISSCAKPEDPGSTLQELFEVEATPKPEDPILLEFPCTGEPNFWNLTASKVREYESTYPGVDILSECRMARQWVIDNNRKTVRGMPAYLNRWLQDANNRGRVNKGNLKPHSPPSPGSEAESQARGLEFFLNRNRAANE